MKFHKVAVWKCSLDVKQKHLKAIQAREI